MTAAVSSPSFVLTERITEMEPMLATFVFAQAAPVRVVPSNPYVASLRRIDVEDAVMSGLVSPARINRLRRMRSLFSGAWLLLAAATLVVLAIGPTGYFLAPLSVMLSLTGSLLVVRRKCEEAGA